MKKKMLLVLSVLLFAGLMWFNLQQVQTQKGSNDSDIAMAELEWMPVVVIAEVGCSLTSGNCISGTTCEVGDITPGDYQWWFNYQECQEFCDPAGSNCCFDIYVQHGCL